MASSLPAEVDGGGECIERDPSESITMWRLTDRLEFSERLPFSSREEEAWLFKSTQVSTSLCIASVAAGTVVRAVFKP